MAHKLQAAFVFVDAAQGAVERWRLSGNFPARLARGVALAEGAGNERRREARDE